MKLTRQQMEMEMEFHQLALGCCLKRRRQALNLPQEQFAARCHVSRGEVQHAEHARHGLRDPTRLSFCLGLGITEVELVAEVDRVKQAWALQGFPTDVEVPKSLAEKLAAIGAEMKTVTAPPPCPSAMTPALLYTWMRAFGSTQGRGSRSTQGTPTHDQAETRIETEKHGGKDRARTEPPHVHGRQHDLPSRQSRAQ